MNERLHIIDQLMAMEDELIEYSRLHTDNAQKFLDNDQKDLCAVSIVISNEAIKMADDLSRRIGFLLDMEKASQLFNTSLGAI